MMDASHSDTMSRVLAALVDERSARRAEFSSVWEAIEAIRLDVRRLAAQQDADRLRGPRPPVRDAAVQTDAIVTSRVDVGTDAVLPQPRRDASAQTDRKSKEPRKATITDLELGLVKGVLEQLDCVTLFRARRVCRTWRAAVDDIVAECASAHAGRLDAMSAPSSDLHLQLLVTRCQMSVLRAPSERGQTDLRIVAGACRSLVQANLRGFRLSAKSLRQLISNNASSLETVIMPAVVTNGQLEALLKPLKKLQYLTVSAPSAGGSRWLLALPDTLTCLDITGPGVTLPPLTDCYGHLTLHVRAVSDQQLHDLRTIASRVTYLYISDCPDVTAAGVAPLFSGLTNVNRVYLRAGLDGAATEAALDGLRGCSQLQRLYLGESHRPVTDVPAAAVGRLAVACRRLGILWLHTTPGSCRAVLSALLAVQQDLGIDSYGRPRTIALDVPDSLVSELSETASGSRIEVI